MKKLLFVGANLKRGSQNVIKEVQSREKLDGCVLILSNREEKDVFRRFGKCYYRDNIARGIYSEEDSEQMHVVPLDDSVLLYMDPWFMEILNQQRRFEEYHSFHISASYESHYTIYMHNLFFWNNLIETEGITHVFFSCIPHEGYDSIIYHLCSLKKIPILMLYYSIIPHREFILTDYLDVGESILDKYNELKKKYQDSGLSDIVLEEDTAQIFEKWSSLEPSKMMPWYAKGNPLKNRFSLRFGQMNLFLEWKEIVSRVYKKYDYSFCLKFMYDIAMNSPEFARAIVRIAKRNIYARPVWNRTVRLNKFYEGIAEKPVEGERYIYFALHYQPEASSNPLGGRSYADQILAINILAESLPDDMKIYVKSHPEQLAPLRSKDYYLDMKRIKKVRLMKMECSTYELMKNAFAVSSLTGTACWEAQFFGIPAILFGFSHKNLAPLSFPVRTLKECRRAISEIESGYNSNVTRELKILTKAMHDISFRVEKEFQVLPGVICEFLKEAN